jgi:Family of unknown function (DUF6491)
LLAGGAYIQSVTPNLCYNAEARITGRSNMKALLFAAALAVGAGAVSVASSQAATDTSPAASQRSCFFSSEWRGWKSRDENTMYLKVGVNDVYEVGFKSGCRRAMSPGVHLVTVSRGSNSVCSPLDLDIKVAENTGPAFPSPCIATSLRKLSDAEAKAIPKKFRP